MINTDKKLIYADITYKVRGADKVIIELKAVEIMPKVFETQLLHYLKVMLVLAVGIIYFFSKTVSAAWPPALRAVGSESLMKIVVRSL